MTTHFTFKAVAVAASLALAGAAIGPAVAQESENGTVRLENVTIVEIVHVSFKPGARTRAMEIIDNYFVPASEAAATPGPMHVYHFDTGMWDMILVWEMKGGFDDLMWYVSTEELKWRAAVAQIAGGEEEGKAIWDEYISLVARAHNEVGHVHNPEEE